MLARQTQKTKAKSKALQYKSGMTAAAVVLGLVRQRQKNL